MLLTLAGHFLFASSDTFAANVSTQHSVKRLTRNTAIGNCKQANPHADHGYSRQQSAGISYSVSYGCYQVSNQNKGKQLHQFL